MNSDEEKELFTRYGWEYDFIYRTWRSPDGNHEVTNDQLHDYNLTRETEEQLVTFIRRFGRLQPPTPGTPDANA